MIPLHKVLMSENAGDLVLKTLYSGMITEADMVKQFERMLSDYLKTNVLAVNSCTSAIALALHLADVGPGDEVISCPLTCTATNVHVVHRGAKLVWCDIDPKTGCVDINDALKRVTLKTKAFLVTDWSGIPVDCSELKRTGIPVIQDAAHSFGATIGNEMAHASDKSGDYVCWSFQAIKHLTCGDGGAIKVPEKEYERCKRLRWFGIDRDVKIKHRFMQSIPEAGYKFHMNDITASIGVANMEKAINAVSLHRMNASKLKEACSKTPIVEGSDHDPGSSCWFYPVFVENVNDFENYMGSKNIGCGPVHWRNDTYECFPMSDGLPNLTRYLKNYRAIPCGWWINDKEMEQIQKAIIDYKSDEIFYNGS